MTSPTETNPWAELDSEPGEFEEPAHQSGFKKYLLIGLGVFVLAAASVALYYALNRSSDAAVGIEFSKPNDVFVGIPFPLTVSFTNYSDSILEGTKLVLSLPDGVQRVGEASDQRVSELSTGDAGPGSVNQQTFNLIALDGAQSLKHLTAKVVYSIPGRSKSDLSSAAEMDIPVGESAIGLSFTVPEKVVNGEDFDVAVRYDNNSRQDLKNVRIQLTYPSVFQFKKSDKKPTSGNNSWLIETLKAGESGTITLSGSALGPEQSSFELTGTVNANFSGQSYAIANQTARIAIAVSPLSLEIKAEDADNYVAHIGETLTYTITYQNNSPITLADVQVRATLVGELYDLASVRSNGSFDSVRNTITWRAANVPELQNLAPGEQGAVEFTVKLAAAFPAKRLSDKNYTLSVRGQIESPTVPPETAISKTVSVAAIENKVAGKLAISAAGYYRDAASGILNSGPYPPKVNETTQYTVHWRIMNYATDVSDIKVSAFMKSGAKFTGKSKSTIDTVVSHNAATGELTWPIRLLAATKGMLGTPVEAIFQIEYTPAVNQVGANSVPLVGEAKIEGTDLFVNAPLTATSKEVTTSLPDDPTVQSGSKSVQP